MKISTMTLLRFNCPSYFAQFTCLLAPQGEVVYKNLFMSQGVYFVVKGIAEAFVKVETEGEGGNSGQTQEKVKGIIAVGKIFGYTRFDLVCTWNGNLKLGARHLQTKSSSSRHESHSTRLAPIESYMHRDSCVAYSGRLWCLRPDFNERKFRERSDRL